MTPIFYVLLTCLIAGTLALVLLCLLRRGAVRLGLQDKPGNRKVHQQPIPAVGGLGIVLTALTGVMVVPELRQFAAAHQELAISLLIIAGTGLADDRLNINARLRFLIEIGCAIAVSNAGIRITSFHGFFGIDKIPVPLQYMISVLIITGVTNAFNLIDGIDGLAGSLALVNCLAFAAIALLTHHNSMALMLAGVCGALVAFLRYNLRPARIFMGDCGSLFLGFLMSAAAIDLMNGASSDIRQLVNQHQIVALVSACFMLPVFDTVRVFIQRARAGKSPFAGDKTHLHHKLISHFLQHHTATRKILLLHLSLIAASLLLYRFIGLTLLLPLQALTVGLYTYSLDFTQSFSRWYRQIKRMEGNS